MMMVGFLLYAYKVEEGSIFDYEHGVSFELVSRGSTATRRIYERVLLSSVLLLLACSEDTNQHVECVQFIHIRFDSGLEHTTNVNRAHHTLCVCVSVSVSVSVGQTAALVATTQYTYSSSCTLSLTQNIPRTVGQKDGVCVCV